MKLATAAQMKELDRKAIEERGIPSIDLMERAAEGLTRAALELLPEGGAEYSLDLVPDGEGGWQLVPAEAA